VFQSAFDKNLSSAILFPKTNRDSYSMIAQSVVSFLCEMAKALDINVLLTR
jgi:hypothetical protein